MAFQRLPSLLSLWSHFQQSYRLQRCWNSTSSNNPLRILFCGSDEFSIASMNALHAEQLRAPQTIESIEVVCRPGKRVGRGLKEVREVPIKNAATKLGLTVHEIDTFTGWTPPGTPVDLIVAVSFGLFVPSRLLNAAKYGGINVHPSLLPDFRGPAPLHHTLLAGKTHTGITLQTLHQKHFDHGIILDQSPAPGLPIPTPDSCTVSDLLALLAPKGAEMLVKGIQNRVFVPPLKDAGWRATADSNDIVHAAKITPEDRHVNWQNWTWVDINRRQRVLGSLWSKALVSSKYSEGQNTIYEEKRIIFDGIEEARDLLPESERLALLPGVPFIRGHFSAQSPRDDKAIYVYTRDGQLLRLVKIKVEGDKMKDSLTAALKARMFSSNTVSLDNVEFSLFHNPLF
ncbi:methionyl-tRNA formyltransferase [Talaromyces islandicus]|uniref:methionyl-tRNA formyltransferase n=1 Tax=Talaromyces islandicus TaxID=28573 RepID=A0A0U1LPW6_TALIS|nr:methionyl-tRNA formyltransferase [Talaromyces islandicus]